MSAPSAAVAVQPYQYISGDKKSHRWVGDILRERCVPRRTTPSDG